MKRTLGAVAVAMALVGGVLTSSTTAEPASTQRPNVLVVMIDDAAAGDEAYMSHVQQELAAQGTTFANNFVNYSLCCPSRATFLTGQYAQNTGVVSGNGYYQFDPSNDLAVWLQGAGYKTDQVGKFLNGYGVPPRACVRDPSTPGCLPLDQYPTQVPPGYSAWHASITTSEPAVYDYELSENGTVVSYGEADGDYKGSVLTRKALAFIRHAPPTQPFFLDLNYQAPHRAHPDFPASYCPDTAKPAPADVGSFGDAPLPTPPSFDEADVSDKPSVIAALPRLDAARVAAITERYRCRLASLQHVDRGVGKIVDQLRTDGRLADTLIVFTSDNGFVQGEHRITTGKNVPYEESIRVPLIVRGPGFPAGATVDAPSINADLAPTIAAAAGVQPGLTEDGIPLQELVANPSRKRDFPIENRSGGGDHLPFFGVRTPRYLYVEYDDGERELYDLATDPYELRNKAGAPAYAATEAWLAARLATLRACAGTTCQTWSGAAPPPTP